MQEKVLLTKIYLCSPSPKKIFKKTTKKRGRPKSSRSKTEGESSKKKSKNLASGNRSGCKGPYKKKSPGYFMKGDLMWYVALRRGLKKGAPEQGIKGFDQSALSNLPRNQSIIMELRVALDETSYKEKSKKYQTRCVSIATSPSPSDSGIGINQDSNSTFDSDSSDVEFFQNGKKEKKSMKNKTQKLSGSITGHEKLHEHFDEPQEIIKFLLESSENNQIDHPAIQDQLNLHKRIRRAEIFDADEKLLYYTGELPTLSEKLYKNFFVS